MDKQKGFTIIELILAVAIMAVLAMIVMSNVTSSIAKGKDSSIRGNLASLATRGLVYMDANGNYNNFCTANSGAAPTEAAIESPKVGGVFTCNCNVSADCSTGTNTKWCSCVPLKVDATKVYCVDSSGAKKEVVSDCATECPSSGANQGVCQ